MHALTASAGALLFGAAIHACAPFADPNQEPLSFPSDARGTAALLLRSIGFNAVHATTVLTCFLTHRVAPRDTLTAQALALGGAAFELLLPWQLCVPATFVYCAVVARRVHALGPVPVPTEDEEDMPLRVKESPPPSQQLLAAPRLPPPERLALEPTSRLPIKMFIPMQSHLRSLPVR